MAVAEELKAAKEKRTIAFKALRRAASALTIATSSGQSITVDCLKKLELTWSEFLLEHKELAEFIADNEGNLEGLSTTVNGKTMDQYKTSAQQIYDASLAEYKKSLSVPKSDHSSQPNVSAVVSPPAPNPLSVSSYLRSTYAKQDLPTWDGKAGKSWLEFKVSWTTEVVPLYKDRQLALARLLRKQIRGDGEKEIEHVSLSDPQCYDTMWSALVARYDNVALNVYVVLSIFENLKACSEDNYQGVLDFIRKINSAHAQLQSLDQVKEVDMVRVSRISALLPRSLQVQWAQILSTLEPAAKYHPFGQFKEFLGKQTATIESMLDMSHTSKIFDAMHNSNSRKHAARTHATGAAEAERKCVLHASGGHATIDCRQFVKMSVRDRFNVCTKHNLCKKCIGPKHGACNQRCSHCRGESATTHHEMLCFSKHDPDGKKPEVSKPYGAPEVRAFQPPLAQSHAGQVVDSVTGTVYFLTPANQQHTVSGHNQFYVTTPSGPQIYGQGATLTPIQTHTGQAALIGSSGTTSHSPTLTAVTTAHESNMAGTHAAPPGSAVGPNGRGPGPVVNQTTITPLQSQRFVYTHGTGSNPTPPGVQDLSLSTQLPATVISPVSPYNVSMRTNIFKVKSGQKKEQIIADSQAFREHLYGLYAILKCPIAYLISKVYAIIFCDSGSDCSLITEKGAIDLGARTIKEGFMDMTTLHGTKTVPTRVVEVPLQLPDGKVFPIVCYTMPELCGTPDQVDEEALAELFPRFDPTVLQRPKESVNILLGADYFQLHPKRELAVAGNLSVMESVLGLCLQGSHPKLSKLGAGSPNPYHSTTMTFRHNYGTRGLFRSDIPQHTAFNSTSGSFTPILGSRSSDGTQEEVPTLCQSGTDGDSTHRETLDDPTSPIQVSTAASFTYSVLPPEVISADPHTRSIPLGDDIGNPLSLTVHDCQPLCPVSMAIAKGSFGPAVDDFILGEKLGTTCIPRCGSCKCGKCPLPGHTYSFKEEQELALIQSKLRYIPDPGKWITGYPWIVDPSTLPDNYVAAYSTLLRTERTLAKDPEWQATYQRQIDDHAERGVARKLSQEELDSYKGPYFYLSHMALEQPKSESTPVRLVFNSSQKYQGVSLNDCLAKGPDSYNNSLLGMLIRFRERITVLIGDIKKMYNTVELELMEQHMHRFLWRSCQSDKKPEVWVITRVNLGDRPSGTIAIAAKNNTAHMFAHIDEEAATMIIYCSYTDDLINSISGDIQEALRLSSKCEEILDKGNFKVKCWTYGGRLVPPEYKKKESQQVLGLFYRATDDVIHFPAKINFSEKRRNVPIGPNLRAEEVPLGIPDGLTRRIVLSQVMGIYDPLGLLSPLVLQAKLLLRQTWQGKLGWDEAMNRTLVGEWKTFFSSLFEAQDLGFDRCITPDGAVGNPQLVILSDGSEEAYGCAAYVRWQLGDGSFWCSLIMAKSRISPLNRVSIPQMELNGAVMNKRIREVITSESRFQFEKVHHLVDSETVLCQLYKVAQKFRVFEGVRIGEIQAATNGNMEEWGWVSGKNNVADLTTRPQPPSALGPQSIWVRGPDFLYLPQEDWPVKRNPHVSDSQLSPGEKLSVLCTSSCLRSCVCSMYCSFHSRSHASSLPGESLLCQNSLSRCSDTDVAVGALARVISVLRKRSFSGGRSEYITPEHRRCAFKALLEETQCSAWTSTSDVKKLFRHVNVDFQDGLWVVASRDPRQKVPLSPDYQPQVLLPPDSFVTRRLMRDSHNLGGHAGRDSTLARFRSKFHTSREYRLADAACKSCIWCRLTRAKLVKQKMGCMPVERLVPGPPFDTCVLDLFGPFMVRGDKNPRVRNIKVWGIIIVDMPSRAVHIEVTPGYDTGSFIISFRRFAAIRGWPSKVFSDPGTQLVGASAEIKKSWDHLRKLDGMRVDLNQHGTQWIFGPSDSPWYQGAAEALIKSAKNGIRQSIHGKSLTSLELLSAFSEVACLMNERPIGFAPGLDNDINILTPNSLLLGRSSSINPGGYHSPTSLLSRVTVVRELVDAFWSAWTELYAPTLMKQSKWNNQERFLRVGDIVLVADSNTVRGEYRLARVSSVHPSVDGIVRKVSVEYVIYKTVSKKFELIDGRITSVPRSVQRLSLIIPVEELDLHAGKTPPGDDESLVLSNK